MIKENLKINPVSVLGIGCYTPETVVTNDDLAKIVDTSDEWIYTRTGIRERRIVKGNEGAKDLALKASIDALEFAGIKPEELDCIVLATSTPDNLYPSVACELQAMLGVQDIPAFDLVAACSGIIYALNVAKSFINSGTYKTVLVVGVDVHSRFVNWEDRSTCVLFGDGAGALVLQQSEDGINDILALEMFANGSKSSELKIPLTGKNCPLVESNDARSQHVSMNGREVYKFAVNIVPESLTQCLDKAGLKLEDLDYFVSHQANIRIIQAVQERLQLEDKQVIANLEKYGNTSAASIPIAFKEAVENNLINTPSNVAFCGFGAGLTWGTAIIRWRAKDKRKAE